MNPKYIYAGELKKDTDIGGQLDFWYTEDPLGHAVIVWFKVPPHTLGTTYPREIVSKLGAWVTCGMYTTHKGRTGALRYKLAGLEDL
jgi:hypothetical protein